MIYAKRFKLCSFAMTKPSLGCLDDFNIPDRPRRVPDWHHTEVEHYSAQASYFAAFRGIRNTKIEKSRGIQDKISL